MLTAAVTNGFIPAETMALLSVTSLISVITETSRVSSDLKPSSSACSHKREAGEIALQVKSLLCKPEGQHSGPQNHGTPPVIQHGGVETGSLEQAA